MPRSHAQSPVGGGDAAWVAGSRGSPTPLPLSPLPWHPALRHAVAGCECWWYWEGYRAHFPPSFSDRSYSQERPGRCPRPVLCLGSAFKLRVSPCWCLPGLMLQVHCSNACATYPTVLEPDPRSWAPSLTYLLLHHHGLCRWLRFLVEPVLLIFLESCGTGSSLGRPWPLVALLSPWTSPPLIESTQHTPSLSAAGYFRRTQKKVCNLTLLFHFQWSLAPGP